ncbi:hypothetical protein KFF03_10340 [Bacterioplanoides sp. SCSIO 12839]|nr:hypothetical protein KFF03_10340 [Bacterioplanoides sp. SCSIO 12839]
MKINVTFDMTPDEFRRVMGLPDVQQFQQELFNQMLEKMQSGEEGYDPLSLYQPMMKEGMSAMGQFQNMMFNMMSGANSADQEK